MCRSPEALVPGPAKSRRHADPPAGAFLTGLATADWPSLRYGTDALFFEIFDRIDPAGCWFAVVGALTANRIVLNACALRVYGSSRIPQNGGDTLYSRKRTLSSSGAPVPPATDPGTV